MKTKLLCAALTAACLWTTQGDCADHGQSRAGQDVTPESQKQAWAQEYTWHGGYYAPQWGAPVALVVPPTARREYNYGWGVNSTRLSRINHQFSRGWRGSGNGPFQAAPTWPQDTSQMGYYYVRGPW